MNTREEFPSETRACMQTAQALLELSASGGFASDPSAHDSLSKAPLSSASNSGSSPQAPALHPHAQSMDAPVQKEFLAVRKTTAVELLNLHAALVSILGRRLQCDSKFSLL